MTLNHQELKNKILGCFNGKNAGGVLGAPFEQLPRGTHDVKFYAQENLNCNPPANDDLDLQLVWLVAAERYGAQVNSHLLAEHWNTFIYQIFPVTVKVEVPGVTVHSPVTGS